MEKNKITSGLKFYRWNEIVFKVLLVSIFCVGMNFVSRNMGGGGIQLPYNNFTWTVTSVFITFTLLRLAWISRLKFTKFYGVLLFCTTLLLLPLTYTDRLFLEVESFRFLALGAGLLFLFCLYQFSSRNIKHFLIDLLLLTSVIQTIWGLTQYYFIFEPGVLFFRADLGLPYGVFQQVNDYASYLAIGSMVAIYKLFSAPNLTRTNVILTFVLLVANFHLTVLCRADSAKFVALISVIVYLIYMAVMTKKTRVVSLLVAGVFISVFLPRSYFDIRPQTLTVASQANVIASQITGASSVQANSIEEQQGSVDKTGMKNLLGTRATIYPVVIEMILDKPWLGHGIGSFHKQYLLYQGRYLQENPDAPAEFRLNHAHNEVLHWVVELGIGAMIAFIILLVSSIHFCRKKVLSTKILLITLPLILHSFVGLPFYHSAPHYLAFFILLFCSDIGPAKRIKVPRLSKFVLIPASLWGAGKVFVFLLSTSYALQMFLNFNDSGRQEIKYLLKVNNPAAFKHRFEFELFQWKIRKAINEGKIKRQDLLNYIYWAFSVTQYSPMESTYENFVYALKLYGNEEAAIKYAHEGVLMFPKNKKLRVNLEELIKSSENQV